MRWLFMLLLVLNVFYGVWHLLGVSPQAKEVAPVSFYRSDKQDIHLVSESATNGAVMALDAEIGKFPSVPVDQTCLFLGGYDQQEMAQAVRQRLSSLDIVSQLQVVDSVAGIDYWVYLAPLGSGQATMRQLKELQARKIDSFIIDQGELVNGISLGIYPRSDSADSVMQRLREAGYEPAVKQLPRAQHAYWVRLAAQSRRLVDEGLLGRLSHDFPGLAQKILPCESIATPG